jgi:predicted nucleic acid-binding protein
MALYMDSSALVKLVVEEAESEDLREFVGDREMASSQIARTELVRAVARTQPAAVDAAEDLVGAVTLIAVSRVLAARAAWVIPRELRSLDALHVASAVAMSANLEALITYDRRMIEAGRLAGLPVLSPGDKPRE